eukprot:403352568
MNLMFIASISPDKVLGGTSSNSKNLLDEKAQLPKLSLNHKQISKNKSSNQLEIGGSQHTVTHNNSPDQHRPQNIYKARQSILAIPNSNSQHQISSNISSIKKQGNANAKQNDLDLSRSVMNIIVNQTSHNNELNELKLRQNQSIGSQAQKYNQRKSVVDTNPLLSLQGHIGEPQNSQLKSMRQPSQMKSITANASQSQKYLTQVKGLRQSQSQGQFKLFETPSYTRKDNTIQTLVENQDLQIKLDKLKHNFAESQIFNPQYNFKKLELKQMTKMQILKNFAQHENINNFMHVANNYDRKIPTTSLNLKFNSAQQYFSFDDPKEKMEIMKLYNMRARVKDNAQVSMKQESLSSTYLSQLKGKRASIPRLQEKFEYLQGSNHTQKVHPQTSHSQSTKALKNDNSLQSKPFSSTTKQALKDLKISQRESEMPRNLVTNTIMSLQRRDFLQRTLYVKKNITNELQENAEKLKRKLDNIYFENEDSIQNSPLFKMQKAIQKQPTQTPQEKLSLLFGGLKKTDFVPKPMRKSEIDDLLNELSPKQDSFDYERENNEYYTQQTVQNSPKSGKNQNSQVQAPVGFGGLRLLKMQVSQNNDQKQSTSEGFSNLVNNLSNQQHLQSVAFEKKISGSSPVNKEINAVNQKYEDRGGSMVSTIVDMLDNNKDLNRLVTKHFGSAELYEQITVQEQQDSIDAFDIGEEKDRNLKQKTGSAFSLNADLNQQQQPINSEIDPNYPNIPLSSQNSFIDKLDKINNKNELQVQIDRPFSLQQYNSIKEFENEEKQRLAKISAMNNAVTASQQNQDLQSKQKGQAGTKVQKQQRMYLDDSAEEEFNKIRKKPKNELQQGLIIKEKALPPHTLIRRKALSIMKYNYQY